MSTDAARIIGLYQRHACAWDRARGRGLFEKQWLDRFLALIPSGKSILDIGCGSGEPIARYFIAQGHPVRGVDSSAPLIALCEERFPGQNWIVADMREPLPYTRSRTQAAAAARSGSRSAPRFV